MTLLTLAYLLIVVGFVLLAAELFLPTGGICILCGTGVIIAGVGLTLYHDPYTGLITLLVVFVALPVVAGAVLYYWPKTSLGKRFILAAPDEDATVASMPVHLELEQLRGRAGRAVSALRPSGVVDFDGRQVDCITEGMMVEPGQMVRVLDVKAGKVIVRPISKPNLGDLESADFS
jgi:membrane-bound serine protease (ClpP class)